MTSFIFDIEADNLFDKASKIWTMQFKEVGNDYWFSPDSDCSLRNFIKENRGSTFIGHNVFGYDLMTIEKVWGVAYGLDFWSNSKVKFIDTLVMSQYYNPDLQGGHGLDAWGKRLGYNKIDYREHLISLGAVPEESPKGFEFSFYHPDMELYCKRDVEVTEKLFLHLKEKLNEQC